MKKETIRRFTRPELWLHWSQAVLYLLLFGSGTLLLIGRLFDHPLVSRESLGKLHRVAGVALVVLLGQALLLSIAADNFRSFWRTLGQCLRWRWGDFIWLLKVPFNAITRRVKLPPSDRFNAGQKLHVLVVIGALAGFNISGLLMLLLPGALEPWIIHLICFVPAAVFLVLHLFLSLVNPETRKALPSIFSGHMSLELARQHHSLWAGQPNSPEHPSYVSLRTVLIMAALVIAVTGIFAMWYGPAQVSSVIAATIAQRGTNAISPAPLAKAHADDDPNTDNCADCHLQMASPPSEKCLVCHTEIEERMAAASGFHGKLSGSCRNCHPEHKGAEATLVLLDRQAFNHGNANFPLDGKHQAVPCGGCHERIGPDSDDKMQYIGLDYGSCTNCHRDPHDNPRAGDCMKCHTMQGWDRDMLTFDHDRNSQFPLAGGHTKLDCEKCHPRRTAGSQVQVQLFDVGKVCRDCHADPHAGQMSSPCESCHIDTGWTGRNLVFSHDQQTSFPLDEVHSTVSCDDCHDRQTRRYRPLSHECGDCHRVQQAAMQGTSRVLSRAPDPHNGRLSCTDCHDMDKPRQGHAEYAAGCATCHNPRYGALFYSWANALDEGRASIQRSLQSLEDPNDARRLHLEQILEDAAAAGSHNLNLAREILRAGAPAHPRMKPPVSSPLHDSATRK